MLQSACRRKKGGRSGGDPVFRTCVHTECPGCSTSHFWWTVSFAPGSVSEFVTPADVLEEEGGRTEGMVSSVFAAYHVNFFLKISRLVALILPHSR